ncbi:MAG: endonuclease [Flavobacterium sp. MedPE-SWcel]|uniref:endonuclease/exonuclease/phosphatase family protein n=1 Tax=uncultured Flavobacterium sp. TaxID=165435 RepID=UPI0009121C38|nr:endonuclease/exonuclease/phosphatase family protein [uncultured Flavobacterium sp.]OIQ22179.1 MAG: endonuclease [Flavobacterium sp. MedPE-SWcel]
MPFYKPLKNLSQIDRNRTIINIERLRNQFNIEKIPNKKASETLILGTWNIRNFDDNRFNYGPRLEESYYYIAEIISRFDIIAVQEICDDVWPLKKLMRVIGGNYDYILTDTTHSSLGGNQERLGFIYDKDKVKFSGIAGEIVLPDKFLISEVTNKKRQFSRTPFAVEFQSGWFKFVFSTVHIYFGSNGVKTPEYKRRVQEIEAISKYLSREAKKSDKNHILVGDFNIKFPRSEGYNSLEKNGFNIVKNLKGSNRDRTKYYDQISFQSRKDELEFVDPNRDDRTIQFFNSVFREEDFDTYKPIILKHIDEKILKAEKDLDEASSQRKKKKAERQIKSLNTAKENDDSLKKYYYEWKSFQMSDHLPLWVEIKVDFSDSYLNYLKTYENRND